MNYYHYKAEDFAADDDFKQWVVAPDTRSDAFWEAFLRENPEKYYAIQEGRELVLGLQQLPARAGVDEQAEKLWFRIERKTTSQEPGFPLRSFWPVKAAAALLFAFGLGWWWQGRVAGEKERPRTFENINLDRGWEETVNSTAGTMEIRLSDGSLVMLEQNSRLRYQNGFNDSLRVLYLKGAAFFEVEKDAGRPFMVHANGLVTKVLGTSFNIQARENDPNVTVSVKTGRVSVYTDKSAFRDDPEAEGIVLTPNQKAVFARHRETLSKTLIEKPEVLQNEAPVTFAFESAPAREVFETLARNYGIEVLYDEELFIGCSLTIDLTNEDLFQKLEVICKVLDARYKLIDAQVIIYGNGCS